MQIKPTRKEKKRKLLFTLILKKRITTGVFKWKKDYNLGAMHFEEAAKLYKASKGWDKHIESLKLCIECNENLGDNWAVARNYEAII